jgi:hypothetical protein
VRREQLQISLIFRCRFTFRHITLSRSCHCFVLGGHSRLTYPTLRAYSTSQSLNLSCFNLISLDKGRRERASKISRYLVLHSAAIEETRVLQPLRASFKCFNDLSLSIARFIWFCFLNVHFRTMTT